MEEGRWKRRRCLEAGRQGRCVMRVETENVCKIVIRTSDSDLVGTLTDVLTESVLRLVSRIEWILPTSVGRGTRLISRAWWPLDVEGWSVMALSVILYLGPGFSEDFDVRNVSELGDPLTMQCLLVNLGDCCGRAKRVLTMGSYRRARSIKKDFSCCVIRIQGSNWTWRKEWCRPWKRRAWRELKNVLRRLH